MEAILENIEIACAVVGIMFLIIMAEINYFKMAICKKLDAIWKRANHHYHDAEGKVVIVE